MLWDIHANSYIQLSAVSFFSPVQSLAISVLHTVMVNLILFEIDPWHTEKVQPCTFSITVIKTTTIIYIRKHLQVISVFCVGDMAKHFDYLVHKKNDTRTYYFDGTGIFTDILHCMMFRWGEGWFNYYWIHPIQLCVYSYLHICSFFDSFLGYRKGNKNA